MEELNTEVTIKCLSSNKESTKCQTKLEGSVRSKSFEKKRVIFHKLMESPSSKDFDKFKKYQNIIKKNICTAAQKQASEKIDLQIINK